VQTSTTSVVVLLRALSQDLFHIPIEASAGMNRSWGQEIFQEIKMRKYIVDLTDNFIGKNNYVRTFKTLNKKMFLGFVKNDLYCGEVKKMSPATLGKIMCSFEVGDVSIVHPGKGVPFAGDCEDMLREVVALCLAYVIRDRLDPNEQEGWGIPLYKASKKKK
jgi:hypothetical protein